MPLSATTSEGLQLFHERVFRHLDLRPLFRAFPVVVAAPSSSSPTAAATQQHAASRAKAGLPPAAADGSPAIATTTTMMSASPSSPSSQRNEARRSSPTTAEPQKQQSSSSSASTNSDGGSQWLFSQALESISSRTLFGHELSAFAYPLLQQLEQRLLQSQHNSNSEPPNNSASQPGNTAAAASRRPRLPTLAELQAAKVVVGILDQDMVTQTQMLNYLRCAAKLVEVVDKAMEAASDECLAMVLQQQSVDGGALDEGQREDEGGPSQQQQQQRNDAIRQLYSELTSSTASLLQGTLFEDWEGGVVPVAALVQLAATYGLQAAPLLLPHSTMVPLSGTGLDSDTTMLAALTKYRTHATTHNNNNPLLSRSSSLLSNQPGDPAAAAPPAPAVGGAKRQSTVVSPAVSSAVPFVSCAMLLNAFEQTDSSLLSAFQHTFGAFDPNDPQKTQPLLFSDVVDGHTLLRLPLKLFGETLGVDEDRVQEIVRAALPASSSSSTSTAPGALSYQLPAATTATTNNNNNNERSVLMGRADSAGEWGSSALLIPPSLSSPHSVSLLASTSEDDAAAGAGAGSGGGEAAVATAATNSCVDPLGSSRRGPADADTVLHRGYLTFADFEMIIQFLNNENDPPRARRSSSLHRRSTTTAVAPFSYQPPANNPKLDRLLQDQEQLVRMVMAKYQQQQQQHGGSGTHHVISSSLDPRLLVKIVPDIEETLWLIEQLMGHVRDVVEKARRVPTSAAAAAVGGVSGRGGESGVAASTAPQPLGVAGDALLKSDGAPSLAMADNHYHHPHRTAAKVTMSETVPASSVPRKSTAPMSPHNNNNNNNTSSSNSTALKTVSSPRRTEYENTTITTTTSSSSNNSRFPKQPPHLDAEELHKTDSTKKRFGPSSSYHQHAVEYQNLAACSPLRDGAAIHKAYEGRKAPFSSKDACRLKGTLFRTPDMTIQQVIAQGNANLVLLHSSTSPPPVKEDEQQQLLKKGWSSSRGIGSSRGGRKGGPIVSPPPPPPPPLSSFSSVDSAWMAKDSEAAAARRHLGTILHLQSPRVAQYLRPRSPSMMGSIKAVTPSTSAAAAAMLNHISSSPPTSLKPQQSVVTALNTSSSAADSTDPLAATVSHPNTTTTGGGGGMLSVVVPGNSRKPSIHQRTSTTATSLFSPSSSLQHPTPPFDVSASLGQQEAAALLLSPDRATKSAEPNPFVVVSQQTSNNNLENHEGSPYHDRTAADGVSPASLSSPKQNHRHPQQQQPTWRSVGYISKLKGDAIESYCSDRRRAGGGSHILPDEVAAAKKLRSEEEDQPLLQQRPSKPLPAVGAESEGEHKATTSKNKKHLHQPHSQKSSSKPEPLNHSDNNNKPPHNSVLVASSPPHQTQQPHETAQQQQQQQPLAPIRRKGPTPPQTATAAADVPTTQQQLSSRVDEPPLSTASPTHSGKNHSTATTTRSSSNNRRPPTYPVAGEPSTSQSTKGHPTAPAAAGDDDGSTAAASPRTAAPPPRGGGGPARPPHGSQRCPMYAPDGSLLVTPTKQFFMPALFGTTTTKPIHPLSSSKSSLPLPLLVDDSSAVAALRQPALVPQCWEEKEREPTAGGGDPSKSKLKYPQQQQNGHGKLASGGAEQYRGGGSDDEYLKYSRALMRELKFGPKPPQTAR